MNFTSGMNYFPVKNWCLYNKQRYKALISGMTDFAHLNNYALEVLTDHVFFFIFYSFCELGYKITISQFGRTAAVKRDLQKKKTIPFYFYYFTMILLQSIL